MLLLLFMFFDLRFYVFHVKAEETGCGNTGDYAHHWGQYQHETDHHTLKRQLRLDFGNNMTDISVIFGLSAIKVCGSLRGCDGVISTSPQHAPASYIIIFGLQP